MAEWQAGDVAWGARWDYGTEPHVGFAVVRQVRKDGLMMKERIPAFRHNSRVALALAFKSEREALDGLLKRLRDEREIAQDDLASTERKIANVELRLAPSAPPERR